MVGLKKGLKIMEFKLIDAEFSLYDVYNEGKFIGSVFKLESKWYNTNLGSENFKTRKDAALDLNKNKI